MFHNTNLLSGSTPFHCPQWTQNKVNTLGDIYDDNNNYNNNSINVYSAFLGTQSNLHGRGESPRPPPMCSIHLDDVMAAILCQHAHNTPAYWWRGDRVMKPISVWG